MTEKTEASKMISAPDKCGNAKTVNIFSEKLEDILENEIFSYLVKLKRAKKERIVDQKSIDVCFDDAEMQDWEENDYETECDEDDYYGADMEKSKAFALSNNQNGMTDREKIRRIIASIRSDGKERRGNVAMASAAAIACVKRIKEQREPVIMCLGNASVSGDSFAPTVAKKLTEMQGFRAYVYGLPSSPITAQNAVFAEQFIARRHVGAPVIAIDAAITDKPSLLGLIIIKNGDIIAGGAIAKIRNEHVTLNKYETKTEFESDHENKSHSDTDAVCEAGRLSKGVKLHADISITAVLSCGRTATEAVFGLYSTPKLLLESTANTLARALFNSIRKFVKVE